MGRLIKTNKVVENGKTTKYAKVVRSYKLHKPFNPYKHTYEYISDQTKMDKDDKDVHYISDIDDFLEENKSLKNCRIDEDTQAEIYFKGTEILKDICKNFEEEDYMFLPNCVYVLLNIYDNILTNEYEDIHEINSSDWRISNSQYGIVMKVGSTHTPNSDVKKRFKNGFDEYNALKFSIPILIMTGNNIGSIESEIHAKLKESKQGLNIGIVNKNRHSKNSRELYEMSDANVDIVYNHCIENGLKCVYENNLNEGESWFNMIPEKIQNALKDMIPDDSLKLIQVEDSLSDYHKKILREKYIGMDF